MRWATIIIALVISVTFGVVVVMQKLALTRVGYELGHAERERNRLAEDLRRLNAEAERLSSLDCVSKRVKELELPLDPPGEKAKS
ncbi:MAG: hypothetical protein L6Q71_05110 [Planctomycetes bacterium]|nr:hypothetical protein [Planctomycetota bacterium]NUQ33613.1 hypothetical protein [Planctomycetaceae bacterium]